MSGSAAEPKAGKVKATTGLRPLLVAGGQTGKGRESLPDFLVEASQRFKLQVRGDGAHAMGKFANAGAVTQKASRNLWVVGLG